MSDKKIQIVEMLRNIYSITDENSLKIYNDVISNKSETEIDNIFNELVKVIKAKNNMLEKLSIDLNNIYNKYEEKSEMKKEQEQIDFNI